jgi:hypothetical protein
LAGSDGDARTQTVLRNSAGHRFKCLKAVAEQQSQVAFDDFPIDGPRTMSWLLREMAKSNMEPMQRHLAWKQSWKLDGEDKRVVQHALLSELLELFGSYDQVELCNTAGGECIARNIMTLEYELKKKATNDDNQKEWFLGRSRNVGMHLIAPELLEHIQKKAAAEAAINKELRRAEEEIQLRKNAGKK